MGRIGLIGLTGLIGMRVALGATSTVTLGWDASATPGVAGYAIYSGVNSGVYTNRIDVGKVLSAPVPRLSGVTNYYAATAYTSSGVESDYSSELGLKPAVSAPLYGLIFLQSSTNGVAFYDLTASPYLRLTNGTGGPLPQQWFRSRTEWTTNWR